jgi:hypothetical protein
MAQLSWERMASQLFARTCHERSQNLDTSKLDLARIVVDHVMFRGVVHFKRNSLRSMLSKQNILSFKSHKLSQNFADT